MDTSHRYGWKSDQENPSNAYLIEPVLHALEKYQCKSMLDIGTGNGATIPIWLSQNLKVAAMEPDEEGFSFSKKHTGADVRQLGVQDELPVEWHSAFDAVVSLEVIEHLFNPYQLRDAISLLLRKGGVAIVSTPYHGYFKNLALAIAGKWDFHHHPERVGGHIKFWSKKTLISMFVKGGFKLLSVQGAGRMPLLWKSMILVFEKV